MATGRVCIILLFLVLLLHFRPPLWNPKDPKPFDLDLTELQIDHAPKDAETMFLGDSITERWRFHQELLANFGKYANLGVGGSRTANLLWLVQSGKLAVFHPRLIVVRIGTNDLDGQPRFFDRRLPSRAHVQAGIGMIVASLHAKFPEAKVVVMPYPPPAEDLASDGMHLNDRGYQDWLNELQNIARK